MPPIPLSSQSGALIARLGSSHGVNAQRLGHLRDAFEASPILSREFNEAVARGCLHRIEPSDDPHSGGSYRASDRALCLPLQAWSATPSGAFNSARIIYSLGRLVRHSLDVESNISARYRFGETVSEIAGSSEYEHDYTDVIGKRIEFLRLAEARADIAGWNALVGAMRNDPKAGHGVRPALADMHDALPDEMSRYIEVRRGWRGRTCALKPGLEVEPGLRMNATTKNLETVARSYSDRLHASGSHDHSNAGNLHAPDAVRLVWLFEERHGRSRESNPFSGDPLCEVRIDLAKLGLDRRAIAQSGIDLSPDDEGQLPYVDRSTFPPTYDVFRHTGSARSCEPTASRLPMAEATCMTRSLHPDHQLYLQALKAVYHLEAKDGRRPDYRSERLAASLVVSARKAGLSAIDRVVLSADQKQAFGVQDGRFPGWRKTAQVDFEQAMQTSSAHASRECEAMRERAPPEQAPRRDHQLRRPHAISR